MNTQGFDEQLSVIEYEALKDAAKRRALQARREAIDEFWSAVGRGIGSASRALRAVRPSAGRTLHRPSRRCAG